MTFENNLALVVTERFDNVASGYQNELPSFLRIYTPLRRICLNGE